MNIYLLYFDTQDFYDGEQFHSAYSTHQKALEFVSRQKLKDRQFYRVDEYELDHKLQHHNP